MSIPVIPIARIYPNRANVRDDLGDVTELAASIKAVGLLQPIVVRPEGDGRFTIVDGHRRYEAALIAGLDVLPCLATRAKDRGAQLEVMLAAAMHKTLEPVEQAHAFARLRDTGLSVADVAHRTGYSPSTISARLAIANLPPRAQQMVAAKEITVADAASLARQLRAGGSASARHREARSVYLTGTHRLAATVKARCTHLDSRRPVGGVGCGQCWEQVIRDDEHAGRAS